MLRQYFGLNLILLEITSKDSCNPFKVECFITENAFLDLFKFIEPLDCNNLPSGVSTFTCYKYKFDINGASWTAGHVFAICTLIIQVLPGCFLFLKRYNAQTHRTWRYPIVLLCLLITLILFIIEVLKFWKSLSFTYLYELLSISLAIFVSLTVPFLSFKPIPASR